MKRVTICLAAGLCVLLAGLTADRAQAQALRRTATGSLTPGATVGVRNPSDPGAAPTVVAGPVVHLRHLPKLARASMMQRTPEYTTTASRTARKPREWAVFDVPYDTTAEWIDDLVFNFSVLTMHRTPEGKTEYGFFHTTVRYADVARGEHMACAVMSGVALQRWGEPVALAVEVAGVDGTTLVSDTTVMQAASLPTDTQKDWWKNPKVTDNASVVKRDGYLVERSKSPFAFVNVDDYEAVK